MQTFSFTSTFSVPGSRLYEWHAAPGAFGRLLPPWQKARLYSPEVPLEDGTTVEFGLRKGPFLFKWRARHQDVQPGRRFTDVQVRGPFRSWKHLHDFAQGAPGAGRLEDHIEYELPGGALGRWLGGRTIHRDLERTFRYRHAVLAEDLKVHEAFVDRPRLTVAVTGATGLIGSTFCQLLTTGGHRVVRVTRSPKVAADVHWDPVAGELDGEALEGVDAVVHLAGENVASGRWTVARKERIRSSRILGTRLLVDTLHTLKSPPGTFVSASAVGFYGDGGQERLSEESPGGTGFLAHVCAEWESEARRAESTMRTALARFGVVLSPRGGALAKMLPAFRLGLGGRLGSGRQVMSWISVEDAASALMCLLLDESLEGPFNLTAPRAVTNQDFTRALGKVLGRPTLLPVPALAVRAALGQMAEEMLLSGAQVLPDRLEQAGFVFRHPTLEPALRHLLGRS